MAMRIFGHMWMLLFAGWVEGFFNHDSNSPAFGAFPHRRLASESEKRRLETAPLYGSLNEFGYYFVDVFVGTPPQRQSVILDSGSSLLGFPCTSCGVNCGKHLDNPFDLSQSSTAMRYGCSDARCVWTSSRAAACLNHEVDTCSYSQTYSEGSSIKGYFFSDRITLGSVNNSFVDFDYIGCHDLETVLFTTQKANGILGISFPKNGKQPTVIDALLGRPEVNSKVFSLCIGEEGGLFSVGGYDQQYHINSLARQPLPSAMKWFKNYFLKGSNYNRLTTPIQISKEIVWTKIESDVTYTISLTSISLLGTIIVSGGFGNTLVDSGTTYSYFPPAIFQSLTKKIYEICDRNNNLPEDSKAGNCGRGKTDLVCFDFGDGNVEDLLKRISPFLVELGNGGVIQWGAESWLYRKTDKVWCSAIEINDRRTQTILGISFVKSKQIIFDRDNNLIGFVSANCPSFDASGRDKAAVPEVDMPMSFHGFDETKLWSWTEQKSLPYINPITEIDKTVGEIHSDATTWVIGGSVGLAVFGGLVAVVVQSITRRQNERSYDAISDLALNTAVFPEFDEFENPISV